MNPSRTAAAAGIDGEALFPPFVNGEGAVVAAVSGGSDSTALLVLLHDFLRRRASAPKLLAVTVDHALRPESAEEAWNVARLAARLGIEHRTLRWDEAKPQTGVIAAAREARYRLLSGAAEEAGARLVLTGHTADDQAETVAMRLARGAGRGLAGMAPLTLFEGRAWIARPLLSLRREALRGLLRERGIGWVDDPSNENPAFERARLRGDAEKGADGLLAIARRTADEREAEAMRAARLIRDHADCPFPGLVRLSPAFLEAPDRDAAVLALRFLLATVGGRVHPVEAERAAALLRALGGSGRHTLGGVLAERRRGGVFLRREERGIAPVRPEAGAVFDNRFRLVPPADDKGKHPHSVSASPIHLSPCPGARRGGAFRLPRALPLPRAGGEVAAEGRRSGGAYPAIDAPSALVPNRIMQAAHRTLPAARLPDGRIVTPDLAGLAAEPIVAPFATFLPGFDLPLAQALAWLVGASPLPSPPGCVDGADTD